MNVHLTVVLMSDEVDTDYDSLKQRVISATQQTGKDALVTLLSEDPSAVKQILCRLCATEYTLHRACLLGDDDLVAILAGGNYININTASPLVNC